MARQALTLSFTVKTTEDPSTVLDWLQRFAVELASQLEDHRERNDDDVEDSCCVAEED
jgi:hypothetical protein